MCLLSDTDRSKENLYLLKRKQMIEPKHIILSWYCGFSNVQELIDDYRWLKEDIKGREKELGRLNWLLLKGNMNDLADIQESIEELAQQTMAINI
jgi:hypothetical protein